MAQDESLEHKHMRCAVCARPLAHHIFDGGERWVHSLLVLDESIPEHEPVPVEHPEMDLDSVSACDFCARAETRWVYRARDFDMGMIALDDGDKPVEKVGWGSVGAWAACDSCHKGIEAGDWARVEYNWRKEWDRRGQLHGDLLIEATKLIWEQFRKNRVGDAEPL